MANSIMNSYLFGPFRLDSAKRQLYRGEERVPVNERAMSILIELVSNAGKTVTRSDLLDRVWPNVAVEDGNLSVNISWLRKALGQMGTSHQATSLDTTAAGRVNGEYITTITGFGYKFAAPVAAAGVCDDRESCKNKDDSAGTETSGETTRLESGIAGSGGRAFEIQAGPAETQTGSANARSGNAAGGAILNPQRGKSRIGNLPIPLTPLIGRERDIKEVESLLAPTRVRLLTLTGAGGSGKTRLALEIAERIASRFPDGAFFASLAAITDPALVAPAIAQVLGIREIAKDSLVSRLREYLREKELLLVLDNFEQVVEAGVLVVDLLGCSPDIKVIVTSRAPLHVRGERGYCVSPLELPNLKKRLSVTAIEQTAAAMLFVERARAADQAFVLDERNAAAVAEICTRLDGLPLAIELAAPQVKVMSPGMMLDRMEQKMEVLGQGPRDLPARQRTIRDTIDWSYELLEEDEKTLFRRLSVFVGGFALKAAEEVCSELSGRKVDALSGIASLLDKNMVTRAAGEDSIDKGPRFLLLETIRERGLEYLESSGEVGCLREQHAVFFCALAENAQRGLKAPATPSGLDVLEGDLDNLRLALDWCVRSMRAELGLRIAGAMRRFWVGRGSVREGRHWTECLLSIASHGSSRAVGMGLVTLGNLKCQMGEHDGCVENLERAVELLSVCGAEEELSEAQWMLGNCFVGQAKYAEAEAQLKKSLRLKRVTGDSWSIAGILNDLALAVQYSGDPESAVESYQESLSIYRSLRDQFGTAIVMNNMADLFAMSGECQRARGLAREALELSLIIREGRLMLTAMETLAGVACKMGQWGRALRLAAAARRWRNAAGLVIPPAFGAVVESMVARAREELDPEEATAAWEEGAAMSEEEAVSYALSDRLQWAVTIYCQAANRRVSQGQPG
ncbi:MAG TPA: tetratricopeptide repeat protein [Blastocatellia bacterium]|nr:tetratricopeptide repeat protein [Blastocatellia bacterium]